MAPRSEMRRVPLQELASSDLAHELAVSRLHLAAHRDDRGAAGSLPAFVGVVIDFGVTVLLRERAPKRGVVHDEVGVAAHLNGTLPGIQSEQAGRPPPTSAHPPLPAAPAGATAPAAPHSHPPLHRPAALGNIGKSI